MHQIVVKSSIGSKAIHNLTHIYSTTSKHAVIYAIMSAKLTDHTLQSSVVKRPRSTMSVQITLENIGGSSSERVEIFTATVVHLNAHIVTSEIVRCVGVADQ